MTTILRILGIISIPIAIVLLGWYSPMFPDWYFYIAIGTVLLTDFMLFLIIPRYAEKSFVYTLTILPLLLVLLGFGVFLLDDSQWMGYAILFLQTLYLWAYAWVLWVYFHKHEAYQQRSLIHLNSYASILTFFYSSLVAYGVIYLLNTPWYYSLAGMLMVTTLVLLHTVWAYGKNVTHMKTFMGTNIVVIVQIWAILLLLPSIYFVTAILFTIIASIILQMSMYASLRELTKRSIIRTLLIGAGMILLVIATSRWR